MDRQHGLQAPPGGNVGDMDLHTRLSKAAQLRAEEEARREWPSDARFVQLDPADIGKLVALASAARVQPSAYVSFLIRLAEYDAAMRAPVEPDEEEDGFARGNLSLLAGLSE